MDLSGKKKIDDQLGRFRREAEERAAQRIAKEEKIPYFNLAGASINLDALKLISEEKARAAKVAIVDSKRKELAIVVHDPKNAKTQELVDELKGKGFTLSFFISSVTGLEKAWERYQEIKAAPDKGALGEVDVGGTEAFKKIGFEELTPKLKEIEDRTGGSSTSDLLDFILGSAIGLGFSDIQFEKEKEDSLLRFRLDGILYDVYKLQKKTYSTILNRLKLLSGLKINVADAAQDGRFSTKFGETYIEIRTSVIPSEYGETVVMRVLDPKTISLNLPDLGLRPDDHELINFELKKPNGTILVTGPTGSGKTTTLYAFLKAVRSPEVKTITIEDPIEYHLDGVSQTQVDPSSGYTFAAGLRSILRQDPDIILVGEIRDLETAEIGMHAALTGHLVFSTLHTNDAIGAIPRLIDLGAKASIIGPALNLIIAQRLIRKLCEFCKIETTASGEVLSKLKNFVSGLPDKTKKLYDGKPIKLFEAKGCEKCRGGFKGRLGVYEFLKCDDELESLITSEATEESIRRVAKKQGMVEMQGDGVLKVIAGVTTFQEVERVTGPIEWLS